MCVVRLRRRLLGLAEQLCFYGLQPANRFGRPMPAHPSNLTRRADRPLRCAARHRECRRETSTSAANAGAVSAIVSKPSGTSKSSSAHREETSSAPAPELEEDIRQLQSQHLEAALAAFARAIDAHPDFAAPHAYMSNVLLWTEGVESALRRAGR